MTTTYPNIVKLNVRGTPFQTCKTTLTSRANCFKTPIETGQTLAKDDSGAIFIDRPAKHFELILNYLKDGFVQLPNSEQEMKEIKTEAGAYGITGLVELCDKKLNLYADAIKLDIGGTIFKSSRSTLTKFHGFFNTMLQSGEPLEKDESGAIFIDRDPKHFRLILNFMRDGYVVAPDSKAEIEEIKKEAKFYQLKNLMNIGKSPAEIYKKLNFDNTASQMMIIRPDVYRQAVIVIYYDIENWNNVFRNIDPEEFLAIPKFIFEEKDKEKIADGHWAFSFHYGQYKDWEHPQVHPVEGFIQKFGETLFEIAKKCGWST